MIDRGGYKKLLLALVTIMAVVSLVPVNVQAKGMKLTVHAKAANTDQGDYRNDIIVSFVIVADLPEGEYDVVIDVHVEGPEGIEADRQLSFGGQAKDNGNTLVKGSTVFLNIAEIKGFYYVDATATINGYSASDSFKFDPPGGSMGPPRWM